MMKITNHNKNNYQYNPPGFWNSHPLLVVPLALRSLTEPDPDPAMEGGREGSQEDEVKWVFPKIVVPPNHPFK